MRKKQGGTSNVTAARKTCTVRHGFFTVREMGHSGGYRGRDHYPHWQLPCLHV